METRHTMVELKALPIHYGIEQCHMYALDVPYFDIITDLLFVFILEKIYGYLKKF